MINGGATVNRPEECSQQEFPATNFVADEDALIRAKIPIVLSIASKLVWKWNVSWIDYLDIAQEGLIGYLRAARRHTENPGAASLNTYAMRRTIGAMIDSISDPYRSENKNKRIPNFAMCDLDDALDIAGDDGRRWCDSIAIKQIYAAFDSLPIRQRDVMRFIYVDGLTQIETAKATGRTEGSVSQLHKAAIEKLRKKYGH